MQLIRETKELMIMIEDGFGSKESHYLMQSLLMVLQQMGYYFTATASPLHGYGIQLSDAEKNILGRIRVIRNAIGHRQSPDNFLLANIKLVGGMLFKNNDVEIQYGETKIFLLGEIVVIHHKLRQLFLSAQELAFLTRNSAWNIDEKALRDSDLRLAEKLKEPQKFLRTEILCF